MSTTIEATRSSVIPEGYTFTKDWNYYHCVFISVEANERQKRMWKEAMSRDPDREGLYMYTEFYSEAVLDIIEEALKESYSNILEGKLEDSLVILEAVTSFRRRDCSWNNSRVWDRVQVVDALYGVSLVTVIRMLESKRPLSAKSFPSLETILKLAVEMAKLLQPFHWSVDYYLSCLAIGWRLFGNKSAEAIAPEEARLEEWIDGLNQSIDQDGSREAYTFWDQAAAEEDGGPWYADGQFVDEEKEALKLDLETTWVEYQRYLQEHDRPRVGPSWRWREWTVEEREEFRVASPLSE